MGRFADYINEKYTMATIAGSGLLGGAVAGGALAIGMSGASPLLGLGAAVVAGVGATLFRPRSEDEINELLKLEPAPLIDLTGGEKALDAKTRKGSRRYLIGLMDKVLAVRESLGEDVIAATIPVFENLDKIIQKWDTYTETPEMEFTIEAILYDYLPTSLENYFNIPKDDDSAEAKKIKGKLIEQLNILAEQTAKIRHKHFESTVQSLDVQGAFLKERFGNSHSDLILESGAEIAQKNADAILHNKLKALN